jgi:adenylosuccinate lyase
LELCRKGLTRSDAYRLVQREALASADGGGDFKTLVLASPGIREKLSEAEIDECFRPERFSRWAGEIVSRALKGS